MIVQSQPQIKSLSYSAIKMFLDNRMKFRKKYILKERVKEENDAIRLGLLVDFYLTCNEADFDKYFLLTTAEKPGGQMGDFVDALKKRTSEAINSGNVITKDLDVLIAEAFNDVKYDAAGNEVKFKKKDISFVLKEFLENKVGYDYYMEFRNNLDKTVVIFPEIEKAKVIVDHLKNDANTSAIFNPEPAPDVEWFDQFPCEVTLEGYTIRMKIDRMKIDNKHRSIKPYDLKITYQVETFEWAYLDDFYYIQNGIYFFGLSEMFPDYEIEPLSFIVGDSNAFLRPLVWHTSLNHAAQGIEGFDYRGRRWKGAKEALREIRWHTEVSNDWRISFDNYRNKGNLSIREFAL